MARVLQQAAITQKVDAKRRFCLSTLCQLVAADCKLATQAPFHPCLHCMPGLHAGAEHIQGPTPR